LGVAATAAGVVTARKVSAIAAVARTPTNPDVALENLACELALGPAVTVSPVVACSTCPREEGFQQPSPDTMANTGGYL
jgi:hypothetical protein